jgi:hypothetical protein
MLQLLIRVTVYALPAYYLDPWSGIGAKKMGKFTKDNIGQPMAVVFIEQKTTTKVVNGKKIRHKEKVEEVISP